MTIYGLGGCGKSALALEFAYHALARHTIRMVFWVPAITQESFELAYREIGTRLRLPGITDANADVKKLVKEKLSSGNLGHWLMIVDNADDSGVLLGPTNSDPYLTPLSDSLPHSDTGAILFTTRSRKAAGDLTPSRVLELNDMKGAEARLLLARRITKQVLLDDEMAVDKLLEILTYLPLAIVQAAAFINSNDISVSGYVSLFQGTGGETELLNEHFEDPSRYRELDSTIAKTWHISFDQIRKQDPLAAEYLSFMACIDRISIPKSLLPPGESLVQQSKALGTLTGYAFITERQQSTQESEGERFFDMHRLVHMASVWWLDGHDERAIWASRAVARLQELISRDEYETMRIWTAYLPHATHAARLESTVDEAIRAELLDRVGLRQINLGQYPAAETTYRQALAMREKRLGADHESTLGSMYNIGAALRFQGRYEEAESMIRRTVARQEEVLGYEHRGTLVSRIRLAEIIVCSKGDYKEAELIMRQTLAHLEKEFGPEDDNILFGMHTLASVLDEQGKLEEAETILRETVARDKKVRGAEHPDTLASMNNLAQVLGKKGKHEEAESLHRETLAREEKVLGHEHQNTLISANNLAVLLEEVGQYEEAESLFRETLARREKVLGPEHLNTLTSVCNLASFLERRYRYEESLVLYERACTGYNTILGKDHPETVECLQVYSRVLALQEQDRVALSSNVLASGASIYGGKRSKL
jgi:tetratricopeptide (TPR) repeat protein